MICKLDIENDFNLVSPDSNEKIKSLDHRHYLSLTRTRFDLGWDWAGGGGNAIRNFWASIPIHANSLLISISYAFQYAPSTVFTFFFTGTTLIRIIE